MSVDVDELLAAEAKRLRGRPDRCKYAIQLERLPDEVRGKVLAKEDTLPYASISRVMSKLGAAVSDHTVRLHLSGVCCCDV